MQGSIAGNCFTRTKAGGAIRNKVKPNNPATASQMRQREAFTRISKQWKTLSEDQRKAWDAFAEQSRERGDCGNIIAMTGHQGFVQMNMNRYNMQEEVTETPDETQDAEFVADIWGDSAELVASIAANDLFVPLGAAAADGMRGQIWTSGPRSAGTNTPFKKLTYFAPWNISSANVAAGGKNTGTDTWYEMYGNMTGTLGKKWTVGLRQYSKSIFSVPKILTTIVIA
jgi:hypothetical protein